MCIIDRTFVNGAKTGCSAQWLLCCSPLPPCLSFGFNSLVFHPHGIQYVQVRCPGTEMLRSVGMGVFGPAARTARQLYLSVCFRLLTFQIGNGSLAWGYTILVTGRHRGSRRGEPEAQDQLQLQSETLSQNIKIKLKKSCGQCQPEDGCG